MMLYKCLKKAQNWLFPANCALCGAPSGQLIDLCAACSHELPWAKNNCITCGANINQADHKSSTCSDCTIKTPKFKKFHALFDYSDPVTKIITGLKFKHKLNFSQLLADLFIEKIPLWYSDRKLPELIIPVPLHKKRIRERGFNQAVEIAKPVSKYLNIPIDIYSCKRTKATQEQSSLPAYLRQENIRGAFDLIKPLNVKHVAIIDDVVTTGETCLELTKLLHNAGVEEVDIWCCAKTPAQVTKRPVH